MSFIDEPLAVFVFTTTLCRYVAIYDLRDLSVAFYRCTSYDAGRGVVTSSDSLPRETLNYFSSASQRAAEEWNQE